MPGTPGSGHTGMSCHGRFHINGLLHMYRIPRVQTTGVVLALYGQRHVSGTGIGCGLTTVWCRHSKDEHFEE